VAGLTVIVVGLMSGTSMDGIDAAVADLDLAGDTLTLCPLGHDSVAYSAGLRADLAAALPPASTTMEAVCRLHTRIGQEFAAAAERAVQALSPGSTADLVVSHGQTVFHWVQNGRVEGTLQLGAPAWIAARTGLPVVSDLRSADVAAGGQGAPLVSLFDVLLLGTGPTTRAALNLGGIANLTVVPPRDTGPPVAYDAGPANALLDAAVTRLTRGHSHCDRDGERAARGRVDDALLAALHDDPYYRRPPPKTTGKEHFHRGYLDAVLGRVPPVGPDALLATLTVHAAEVVAAECVRHQVEEVIASGGGTANPVLMKILADRLGDTRLSMVDDLGIPSAAKEAYAFAVLGYLSVSGLTGTVPACTGARRPVILGSINPGVGPLRLPPPAPAPPSRLVVVAQSR
jgi:anhydro-N-acetylmuramic acid kinase